MVPQPTGSDTTHLILVRLLLDADGVLAAVDEDVDLLVAADGPQAVLGGGQPLELHAQVGERQPAGGAARQPVHPPQHVHTKQAARHGHQAAKLSRIISAHSQCALGWICVMGEKHFNNRLSFAAPSRMTGFI